MNPTFNTVEELIVDNSFRKWVLQDDPASRAKWQQYLSSNPNKKDLIEEARQFLLHLPRVNYQMSDFDFETIWAQIEKTSESTLHLQSNQTSSSKKPLGKHILLSAKWYFAAASIALLLLMVGIGQMYYSVLDNSTQSFQTQFGEKQTVELPDGSTVTLNANSTLSFSTQMFSDRSRKVKIRGEAFFKINKLNESGGEMIKFTVETDDLEVEVLGTEFNVNTRRSSTKVVLTEGKVQIKLSQIITEQPITMVPGEKVTYTLGQKEVIKERAKLNVATAWKQNELIFEDTSVREIINILEDNYGLQIVLKKADIADRHYTGTFKNPDPDVILMALSGLFDLKLERHDQTITLN